MNIIKSGGKPGGGSRISKTGRLLVYLIPFTLLFSCESARFDMRKLQQPVVMNGNPFICGQQAVPSMESVDHYISKVSKASISASSGYVTTNQNIVTNEAQVKAFEKIGGDPSLTITDVALDTESLNINALIALASSTTITATGTVKKISLPADENKEASQTVKADDTTGHPVQPSMYPPVDSKREGVR